MANKPIGVFDSGLGGLTVVKSIMEALPNEDIIYLGDTAHVPYGTRSREQIITYASDCAEFLNSFDIKAMVIACNTADATARQTLIEKYPDLPIYGVVTPAAETAARSVKSGNIGVIATNATIDSRAYEKLIAKINPQARVIGVACPLLVPLVENNRYKKDDKVIETVLREYLEPLKKENIQSLVLGCTHYPLLRDLIEYIMPGVRIISSSDEAALALKNDLAQKNMLSDENDKPSYSYYVTDNPNGFCRNAELFLGGMIKGEVKIAN